MHDWKDFDELYKQMTSNVFNMWKVHEYRKLDVFIENVDVFIENIDEFTDYFILNFDEVFDFNTNNEKINNKKTIWFDNKSTL